MNLKLQIKNYRCFSDENPARFELRKGIHAFVGPNNSGKSSLLKLFYDFRDLFRQLRDMNQIVRAIENADISFNYPRPNTDPNELFFDGNTRDIEISIDIAYSRHEESDLSPGPTRVAIRIPRGRNSSFIHIESAT